MGTQHQTGSKHHHQKGLALIAAIATLVVCMLLLAAGFALASQQRAAWLRQRAQLQVREAAYSGVELVRARIATANNPSVLTRLNGMVHTLDMVGEVPLTIKLETTLKMGYPWVRSTGVLGQETYEVEVFLASTPYNHADFALFVEHSSSRFNATGNTAIDGDVAVPNGVINAIAFQSRPAATSPFLSGRLENSQSLKPPPLKPWVVPWARKWITQAHEINVGIATPPKEGVWSLNGQTLKVSASLTLNKEIKEIRGPGTLLIRGDLILTGPIRITGDAVIATSGSFQSEEEVVLGASLFAGKSVTLQKAKGIAVVMARETLTLGPDLEMKPPSVVGLLKVEALGLASDQRIILKGGTFRGTLLAWDEEPWETPIIYVSGDIGGYLYCSGKAEFRSLFKGHAYIHELQTSFGSRSFANWINDLQMQRQKDEISWPMPLGFSDNVEVLEWVKR